jgi:single-strand DNA-binding protein
VSINRFIVMGRLGADPEMHYTPSGEAVARVRVATVRTVKNRETGDVKNSTEWHRLVAFGRRAEVIASFCFSGDTVYFESFHRSRKYVDSVTKKDRYVDEFVITLMELTARKGEANDPGDAEGGDTSGAGDVDNDDIPL